MKNARGFPLYVRLGLLGINSRRAALVQFWTAVAVSVLLLVVVPGISHSFFWTMVFCGSVLLTAKWYWSAIQWVDAYAVWGTAPAVPGAEGGNAAPGAHGGNATSGTEVRNEAAGTEVGNVASGMEVGNVASGTGVRNAAPGAEGGNAASGRSGV